MDAEIFLHYQAVVFEYPFLYRFTLLLSLSVPVLHSIEPVAFIPASIHPSHTPFTMHHILEEHPLVLVPAGPDKMPTTVFLVVGKLTRVDVSVLLPYPLAMPQPIFELPFVDRARLIPDVHTLTLRSPVVILP